MRDVYQQVLSFNQGRDPRFLSYKYQLMSSSAFRFFRGSCHLFYADLIQQQTWPDTTLAWICGDLHIENFGSYKSDNHVVYFDLNDFDEAILGYPTWDLVRFICSVFLAGQELRLNEAELKIIAEHLCDEYIAALRLGKAYVLQPETLDGLLKKYMLAITERDELAFLNAHSQLDKHNNRTLLLDHKKYFPLHDTELKHQLLLAFQDYLTHLNGLQAHDFHVVDVAVRMAGTGSIGLSRYVFLVLDGIENTYVLYDVKQAQSSSLLLSTELTALQPVWNTQAERIYTIQNYMEYMIPAGLSYLNFQNKSYLVKKLQSEQDKMNFKQCLEKPKKMMDACHYMARLMAYAQIRSAGRKGSATIDELIQFAQHESLWKTQLLEYAYNYYQQVLADYDAFFQVYRANQQ